MHSGTKVRSWRTLNRQGDSHAYSGSATIDVASNHKYMWYAQPLSTAYLSTGSAWQPVRDMSLSFDVPRSWRFILSYNFLAQPDFSPNKAVLTAPDFLGARLVVDGKPYRESVSSVD